MVKISLFRRLVIIIWPAAAPVAVPTDEDLRRMVHDLVRERLMHAVGPDGSFAISMRRGNDADIFFNETFAESMAWDVALNVPTGAIRSSLPSVDAPSSAGQAALPSSEPADALALSPVPADRKSA